MMRLRHAWHASCLTALEKKVNWVALGVNGHRLADLL